MKTNSEQLLQLIRDNPELPIVPMVDYECCGDDSCQSWLAAWGSAGIKEYTIYESYGEGRVYYREDADDLTEYISEHSAIEDDTEALKAAEKQVAEIAWTKAIVVNINSL